MIIRSIKKSILQLCNNQRACSSFLENAPSIVLNNGTNPIKFIFNYFGKCNALAKVHLYITLTTCKPYKAVFAHGHS